MDDSVNKPPSWLAGRVAAIDDEDAGTAFTLCSLAGQELLELWVYGDLRDCAGQILLTTTEDGVPALVHAKDPESGEEFVVFDGARHGYNNLFVDEWDAAMLDARELTRLEVPPTRVVFSVIHNIDYAEEREDFDPDGTGNVSLIDGSVITWDQLLTDGFDSAGVSYLGPDGEQTPLVEEELA